MKRFLLTLFALWIGLSAYAGELWIIEQDFIKFGKKEAYERYKSDLLKEYPVYAWKDINDPEYLYLRPLKSLKALGAIETPEPYASTINFSIQSLHAFLPECSFVPTWKESLFAYPAVYYYLYSIVPGNTAIFEEQLKKVALDQKAPFRTWKVLMGADVPKYIIAVFGNTTDEAKKSGESMEFITPSMKPLLRNEKHGAAILRRDLSTK